MKGTDAGPEPTTEQGVGSRLRTCDSSELACRTLHSSDPRRGHPTVDPNEARLSLMESFPFSLSKSCVSITRRGFVVSGHESAGVFEYVTTNTSG